MATTDTTEGYTNGAVTPHYFFGYSTDTQELLETTRFVRQAVDSGAQAMCVTDPYSASELHSYLVYAGLRTEELQETDQLRIEGVDDTYLAGGDFHPERMADLYRESARRAVSEGWTGLWVAAGTSWAIDDELRADRLVEYEEAVTSVFTDNPARALCLYDRRLFPPRLLQRAAAAHPTIIEGPAGSQSSPSFRIVGEAPQPLRVTGEIDLSGAGEFSKRIASLVDRASPVVLDLSGVEFIDIGGLRVLVDAAHDPRVRLLQPSRAVRSLASLTGVDTAVFEDAQGDSP